MKSKIRKNLPKKSVKTTNVRPGGTVLKSSEKKFDIVRACVNFICLMVVKLKNLTQDPTNAQRILGVKVSQDAQCDTDHRLVLAKVRPGIRKTVLMGRGN